MCERAGTEPTASSIGESPGSVCRRGDTGSTAIDQTPSPVFVNGEVGLTNRAGRPLTILEVTLISRHNMHIVGAYLFASDPHSGISPGTGYGSAASEMSVFGIKSIAKVPGAIVPPHTQSWRDASATGALYGLVIESRLTPGATVGSYAGLKITYRVGGHPHTVRVRASETLCSSVLKQDGTRDDNGDDPACVAEQDREQAAQDKIIASK